MIAILFVARAIKETFFKYARVFIYLPSGDTLERSWN